MKELIRRVGKPDTRTILAVLSTLGFFSFIGLLFIVKVPHENVPILNTLLPMTLTLLGVCFGYYYGSAKADTKKSADEKAV